jgi:biopolymer transport protein ExbB
MIYVIRSGGPVMVALAVLSILMYQAIIGLFLFVRRISLSESTLAFLAKEESTEVGHDEVVQIQLTVIEETRWRFKQLVQARLKYAQALLAAAPLLGLLGTVMGMLDTFRGLSLQLGQETSRAVADGISRALITTETGLMVAIPALFLIHWIKREVARHDLSLIELKMRLIPRN